MVQQIKATSASGDAGRSEALSMLIIDEAAFIKSVDSNLGICPINTFYRW
jgi:hypothetical protein